MTEISPEQIDAYRWTIAAIRASQADRDKQAEMFDSFITDPELRTGALIFIIKSLLVHLWMAGIDPEKMMAHLAENAAMLG